jgi:hypothetical protein
MLDEWKGEAGVPVNDGWIFQALSPLLTSCPTDDVITLVLFRITCLLQISRDVWSVIA